MSKSTDPAAVARDIFLDQFERAVRCGADDPASVRELTPRELGDVAESFWVQAENALTAAGYTIAGPGCVAYPIKLSSIERIYTNWTPTLGSTALDVDIGRELEDAMATDVIRQNATLGAGAAPEGEAQR